MNFDLSKALQILKSIGGNSGEESSYRTPPFVAQSGDEVPFFQTFPQGQEQGGAINRAVQSSLPVLQNQPTGDYGELFRNDPSQLDGTVSGSLTNQATPISASGTRNTEIASVDPMSLDESVRLGQQDLTDAINQPVQKKKWWKDALFKGATVFSNAYQADKQGGGQQLPVQGLSRAQYNQNVQRTSSKLFPLQQQQQYESQRSNEAAKLKLMEDKPALEREKLRNRIDIETQRFNNRMKIVDRQADIKSGEAKKFVDENGMVWKQFLKPDAQGNLREMEPVVNPTTGEQDFAPGEQMVDWEDPLTKVVSKQKAKDILMPGATLAAGNANRQTEVDKFNAKLLFDAEKDYSDKVMAYNKIVSDQAMAIAKASGASDADFAESEGIRKQMEQIAAEQDTLVPNPDALADDKKNNEIIKRKNDLTDQFVKLNGELWKSIGKTKGGREALEQYKSIQPKMPSKVNAPKVQATQVGGGMVGRGQYAGQVFASPTSLRSYFPNKSDAEIKQIVEAQGGKFQ